MNNIEQWHDLFQQPDLKNLEPLLDKAARDLGLA